MKFQKVKVIKKQLVKFMKEYFSPLISAYRTNYISQHVIIRLRDKWRKKLDDNFVVGAALTDLSKAFDSIPHDLLVAKLAAYGLSKEALMYINLTFQIASIVLELMILTVSLKI